MTLDGRDRTTNVPERTLRDRPQRVIDRPGKALGNGFYERGRLSEILVSLGAGLVSELRYDHRSDG